MILDIVSTVTKVHPNLISRSHTRVQKVCNARQIVYYLCRDVSKQSYPLIGRLMHKDHSSVISGYNKILKRAKANPAFQHTLNLMRATIEKEIAAREVVAA